MPTAAADLCRVRDAIGPVHIPGRPDLAGLVGERSEPTRRWVRPTLPLLAHYALGGPDRPADGRVIRCAAAAELIHVGSLYHDDVIDQARHRRGEPSHNALRGSGLAVLGGDLVMLRALRLLAEQDSRVVLAGVLASEEMCAGMVAEAADRYLRSRSEHSYWQAVGGKTGALLSLSCRLGAAMAEQDTDHEEALARFGHLLGLSYQLRDDIIDLTAAPGQLGKPVNNDLVEGVYTLPVLWALAREPRLAPLLRRGITPFEAVETVRGQAREHLDLLRSTCAYAPALVRTVSADPAEQAAYARLVANATDRLTLMLDWQRHSARFRNAADPAAAHLARLRAEIALPTGP